MQAVVNDFTEDASDERGRNRRLPGVHRETEALLIPS